MIPPEAFAMSPAEAVVLVLAALLGLVADVEGRSGILSPVTGAFLSALAVLAAFMAFLHMGAP